MRELRTASGAPLTPKPSFRHRGQPVKPGEVIVCDVDIARMLVEIHRAEFVDVN